jgi:hypothetical protein
VMRFGKSGTTYSLVFFSSQAIFLTFFFNILAFLYWTDKGNFLMRPFAQSSPYLTSRCDTGTTTLLQGGNPTPQSHRKLEKPVRLTIFSDARGCLHNPLPSRWVRQTNSSDPLYARGVHWRRRSGWEARGQLEVSVTRIPSCCSPYFHICSWSTGGGGGERGEQRFETKIPHPESNTTWRPSRAKISNQTFLWLGRHMFWRGEITNYFSPLFLFYSDGDVVG